MLAIGALKGAPGATTTALALAHVWPGADVVVAECDPSGGDLSARLTVTSPGVLGLAADSPGGVPTLEALRRQLTPLGPIAPIARPRQPTDSNGDAGRVLALVGHRSAAQSTNPLRYLSASLSDLFRAMDADVLIDCGRLYPESPALAFVERADQFVVVVRPTPDELPRLLDDLPALASRDPLLVLRGRPSDRQMRYSADEVETALGLRVIGTIEEDADGAAALAGRPTRVRHLDRTPLIASARDVAASLTQAASVR